MFDAQDRAYFAKRAEFARRLEADALDPAIKKIHAKMADEYERRSRGETPQSMDGR